MDIWTIYIYIYIYIVLWLYTWLYRISLLPASVHQEYADRIVLLFIVIKLLTLRKWIEKNSNTFCVHDLQVLKFCMLKEFLLYIKSKLLICARHFYDNISYCLLISDTTQKRGGNGGGQVVSLLIRIYCNSWVGVTHKI